ncbi:uncharacterized protein LOC125826926 [Solanum verrucosum]|uniref:uncharacterized protein LOC125826926 n=1 Tax=Solanum verrucosum TaxID=315347 RepID=UPI0020D0927A|nr:uncharacterized protein LOC125826926 [Solanum verrucosum]
MKKPTKLTLWEDFIDHEGVKLFNQLHDYPIILARKIGKSSSGTSNRFVGLTSKFNTTIEINPPYPQAAELRTWIKTIETKLVSYKMKSTTPIGSIMLIPFEDEVISVANIQLEHFCCDSRNSHFLHSFDVATVCRVLQAFDVAMWMPYVPVRLRKLKIFSPRIAGDLIKDDLENPSMKDASVFV